MSNKEHLSIRIKSDARDKRINKDEWKEFQNMQHYFKKTVPYMIEAALAYEEHINNERQNTLEVEPIDNPNCINVPNVNVNWLKSYIKEGKIYKQIEIMQGEKTIYIPKNCFGTKIKFFKPYILSFETSIYTRITLDLTKKMIVNDTQESLRFCVV